MAEVYSHEILVFAPSDTIICSIAKSYYILLRGDLQSPHKKSYCGFCTGRIMLYCTLFMSASVRVTSHVFQKNYQLDKFRIHINCICKSAFLDPHCLEKGHNASVCCASLKIHVIIFTKPYVSPVVKFLRKLSSFKIRQDKNWREREMLSGQDKSISKGDQSRQTSAPLWLG